MVQIVLPGITAAQVKHSFKNGIQPGVAEFSVQGMHPGTALLHVRMGAVSHIAGHGGQAVLEEARKAQRSRFVGEVHTLRFNGVVIHIEGQPGMETKGMEQLAVRFGGRYLHRLVLRRNGAQRPFLGRQRVFHGIGVDIGKLHLAGLQGIQRSAEQHRSLQRLRHVIEESVILRRVRESVSGRCNLDQPSIFRVIPVQFIGTIPVRNPFQAGVVPAKIHRLLEAGLQDGAPLPIGHFIQAVPFLGDAEGIKAPFRPPGGLRGLYTVRNADPLQHGAVHGAENRKITAAVPGIFHREYAEPVGRWPGVVEAALPAQIHYLVPGGIVIADEGAVGKFPADIGHGFGPVKAQEVFVLPQGQDIVGHGGDDVFLPIPDGHQFLSAGVVVP